MTDKIDEAQCELISVFNEDGWRGTMPETDAFPWPESTEDEADALADAGWSIFDSVGSYGSSDECPSVWIRANHKYNGSREYLVRINSYGSSNEPMIYCPSQPAFMEFRQRFFPFLMEKLVFERRAYAAFQKGLRGDSKEHLPLEHLQDYGDGVAARVEWKEGAKK